MGLETFLIVAGLIMEAIGEHGDKFDRVGHTCVTIGLLMLAVELVLLAVLAIAKVGR